MDLDFVAVFGPALTAPATNLARAGLAGRVLAQARAPAVSSVTDTGLDFQGDPVQEGFTDTSAVWFLDFPS